jgi:hypothetical protein
MKQLEINEWLERYIFSQVEGEDCVDNLRWAEVDDPEQMKAFRKAAEEGCCGSFSGQVVGPDGKKYVVGCNYGH